MISAALSHCFVVGQARVFPFLAQKHVDRKFALLVINGPKSWILSLKKFSVPSNKMVKSNSALVNVGIRGRRMPKKVGSRLRTVTQNVNKVGFRLRSVTQNRNQGRFPVTVGYAWLRTFAKKMRNRPSTRVTAWPVTPNSGRDNY